MSYERKGGYVSGIRNGHTNNVTLIHNTALKTLRLKPAQMRLSDVN